MMDRVRTRCGIALWLAFALCGNGLLAQEPRIETTIGMEGSYFLLHRGERIYAKPLPPAGETEKIPPFLVWIVDRVEDGDAERYELRFSGNEAGIYDLGAYLENSEGVRPTGLEPMLVRVVALLPERHDGSLRSPAPAELPTLGGYQTLLWILGIAWAVPVVWWIGSALWRRRPVARAAAAAPPTLADQLRPLIEAAIERSLDASGQARLERMLMAHWRDRLALRGMGHLEALQRMRADPDAGALLAGLEAWLHRRAGSVEFRMEELLAPYRTAQAIEDPELALLGSSSSSEAHA